MKRRFGGTLRAAQVALTPLSVDDVPTLFRWINTRDDVLLSAPYRPISERQHASWFEEIQQRKDVALFGIRLVQTGALIGSCQLHSINTVHRTAELQIRIGEGSERGSGRGSEAVLLLLDFGFRDLNLNRIFLHVFATNEPALRMYEKVGFTREGVLRRAAYIDGSYVDIVVMGILREEHVGR
jgi:diamine N-acetyltransferase